MYQRDARPRRETAVLAGHAAPDRRRSPGRTAPRLAAFLLVSVVGAVLAVATPVLAGRVVDAIVGGGPLRHGGRAGRADRGHRGGRGRGGIVQRWLSATLGEGLILDLRAAVFDHVQRQPIAFFTRTRTGALVSRLNNDVIGAQRAFSDTLSGVVGNVVTLALTLVVMLGAVLAGHRCSRWCCCRCS